MSVLEKLEVIREKLIKSEDVFLKKGTFIALIQESKVVSAWNECGLLIAFETDARLLVSFETKNDALVQVIRVEMPRTWNAGALFEGKVATV